MNRDDAIRSVNAWLAETIAEAKQVAAGTGVTQDEVDAFVKDQLVRTAGAYGLALTDDAGEALP